MLEKIFSFFENSIRISQKNELLNNYHFEFLYRTSSIEQGVTVYSYSERLTNQEILESVKISLYSSIVVFSIV